MMGKDWVTTVLQISYSRTATSEIWPCHPATGWRQLLVGSDGFAARTPKGLPRFPPLFFRQFVFRGRI
jgi:hypothetical protein